MITPLFSRFFPALVFTLIFAAAPRSQGADWPARVFAPYLYVGSDIKFQIAPYADATGQKNFTLAFLIADRQRNLAWDGRFPATSNFYADDIAAIRARGGDVIVSFGGELGHELALVDKDPASLQAKYERVIARYQLTWLDFDIEGNALHNTAASQRRNLVLARLQAAHPGLRISYTLPVNPNGLTDDGLQLLRDARTQGVKVYSANVMTMYFPPVFLTGKAMSDICIASVLKAREECQAIDPAIQIGVTPCIGENGDKTQIFTEADAAALETWAAAQPWICSLAFWSVNRDAGLPGPKSDDGHNGIASAPWAFTRLFQPFTAGK